MEIKEANLNNYVRIFDNVFNKIFLKKLNDYAEINPFQLEHDAEIVGRSHSLVDKKTRDCSQEQFSLNSKSMTNIGFTNRIGSTFCKYIERYIEDCEMQSVFGSTTINDIILLRYDKEGHYLRHVDSGTKTLRTLSLIFFINDDYKGGEVEFSLPYNENMNTLVKPKSNRLIIFPSNFLYPHKVLPVETNKRYSIVAWTI